MLYISGARSVADKQVRLGFVHLIFALAGLQGGVIRLPRWGTPISAYSIIRLVFLILLGIFIRKSLVFMNAGEDWDLMGAARPFLRAGPGGTLPDPSGGGPTLPIFPQNQGDEDTGSPGIWSNLSPIQELPSPKIGPSTLLPPEPEGRDISDPDSQKRLHPAEPSTSSQQQVEIHELLKKKDELKLLKNIGDKKNKIYQIIERMYKDGLVKRYGPEAPEWEVFNMEGYVEDAIRRYAPASFTNNLKTKHHSYATLLTRLLKRKDGPVYELGNDIENAFKEGKVRIRARGDEGEGEGEDEGEDEG